MKDYGFQFGGSTKIELSVALPDNALCRPIHDGRIRINGATPIVSLIHPSELFWRQLRFAEFDMSDMSLSSLLIAYASGNRDWVALPIFTMRRFFHTGVLVRRDAGISEPADLRGKRVGVPEYQQTAAIWTRGVLQEQFGVHPSECTWYMERNPDRSHASATQFRRPEGVVINQIPSHTNIGEMLLAGELDATLLYLNDPNLVDRSRSNLNESPVVRPLFPDQAAEGRRYFSETGIYPINHALVIRRSLLEKYPWLCLNVFSAFVNAKDLCREECRKAVAPYLDTGMIPPEFDSVLNNDPTPYGFNCNRPVLDLVARYVYDQGLIDKPIDISEVFAEQARLL